MGKLNYLLDLYIKLYKRYILHVHSILVISGFVLYFYFFISNPYAKLDVCDWHILQGSVILFSIAVCFLKLPQKLNIFVCGFLSIERGLFYIIAFVIPLNPAAVLLFIEGLPIMHVYYNTAFLLLNSYTMKYIIIPLIIANYSVAFLLLYAENKYFSMLSKEYTENKDV